MSAIFFFFACGFVCVSRSGITNSLELCPLKSFHLLFSFVYVLGLENHYEAEVPLSECFLINAYICVCETRPWETGA